MLAIYIVCFIIFYHIYLICFSPKHSCTKAICPLSSLVIQSLPCLGWSRRKSTSTICKRCFLVTKMILKKLWETQQWFLVNRWLSIVHPTFSLEKSGRPKFPGFFHVLAQLQPASTRGPRLLPAPRPEVTAGRPLDAFFYVTPSFPWQWNEIILNVPTYSIIVSPMSPKKRNCAELCGTKSSRLFTCGTPVIWPSAIPG